MSKNKNVLLRVTQMNALYLDKEIYNSLYQIFVEATRNLPPGFIGLYEPELHFILQFLLLNNSVVKSGSTFGQQLLSIKYEDIGTIQRLLYLLGHCLDYVKTKFEVWKPSHEINNKIFKIYMVMKLFDFINLSIFLRNGVKPLLVERILGLNQVYATENAQRHFESKYLARELLWNGFIEILVYIIPLINYHKLKRTVRTLNPFHVKNVYSVLPNRGITIHTKCAHCGQNPILPHHMGCTHIFCYVCLKGNQAADSMFECPVCEHKNINVVCDKVTVKRKIVYDCLTDFETSCKCQSSTEAVSYGCNRRCPKLNKVGFKFAPRFMRYAQQDAQEFLRYLLEGLHEDINRVQEKPKPILTEIDEKLSDNDKAQEYWLRYLKMDNSKIVDNFVGQLKSTLRCTYCNHYSVTFDPFWDLSLPIPQRTGQLRLSQCLDSFTREESLDGDEKPTCSKCKERRRFTKSFSIHKFPKILVIHLKRFSPTERFRGKLNITVDFPLEGLDMSRYAADNVATSKYNLYAISNHSGTTYSGHYTAYCRHPYTGHWHEYNDSKVSSISPKSLVSGEAYVLFYEQENTKSHLGTNYQNLRSTV